MHLQPGREEGLSKCPSRLPPPTNKRRASPGPSHCPGCRTPSPLLQHWAAWPPKAIQGHPAPGSPAGTSPQATWLSSGPSGGGGAQGIHTPALPATCPGAVPTGCSCSVALASQWNQRRASCPDHRVPKNRRQLPGPAKIYRLFTFQQLLLWVINVT